MDDQHIAKDIDGQHVPEDIPEDTPLMAESSTSIGHLSLDNLSAYRVAGTGRISGHRHGQVNHKVDNLLAIGASHDITKAEHELSF